MIGIGKVYGNLMVDMKDPNDKLQEHCNPDCYEKHECTKDIAEALEHAVFL